MPKTILITGASSGIGKSIVKYFSQKGWNVAATMRQPHKSQDLEALDKVKTYKLDVLDKVSIQKAIDETIHDFGGIDVIVNNAGYGAVGIFEKASDDEIKKQYDVNVFGVMSVIKAILPHFREKRDGTIINITSIGGRITFPLYSLYHGTKWALEGFAESLHFELKPLGIRVKNVEPGAIKTDFYSRSQVLFKNAQITDYDSYEKIAFENTQKAGEEAPGPLIVAQTVYKAATSESFKLRYPVGFSSKMLLWMRRNIPLNWYFAIVRMIVEKGYK